MVAFLVPGHARGFFDRNDTSSLTIVLAVDVSGSAYITPFVMDPTGKISSQPPILLTSTKNHIFPSITIPKPASGLYHLGFLVKGHSALGPTVTLNRGSSSIVEDHTQLEIRVVDSTLCSVNPQQDELTWLVMSFVYTDRLSSMLPP